MKRLRLLLIIGCFLVSLLATTARSQPSDEFTVGVITLSPPESYMVMEDPKTRTKRLYKKDDYDNIKGMDLKFLQSLLIDTIEYRYRPVQKKVKFVSEEFELVELKQKKAVLKRDYIEEPEEIMEEAAVEEEEEIIEKEIAEETAPKKPRAKRLMAEFFFKIETKKISDHEWEVSLPTLMGAAANFSDVLGVVAGKIEKVLEPEKETRIFFKTSLGKVSLGSDGLLIESLNSRLKSKCGLKDKDLIKSANGKNLIAIQDVAAVFSSFSSSPQTTTLKLVRDEDPLTFTYYIR